MHGSVGAVRWAHRDTRKYVADAKRLRAFIVCMYGRTWARCTAPPSALALSSICTVRLPSLLHIYACMHEARSSALVRTARAMHTFFCGVCLAAFGMLW